MIGFIVRIVEGKQFGFIKSDNGVEYFFHVDDFISNWTEMKQRIKLGQHVKVTFEEASSSKGPRARNVELANG